MKFNYKLISPGWARCELKVGNETFSEDASYITDALGDFLQALLLLNPDNNEEFYRNETACTWSQEPGVTEWKFKLSNIKSDAENLSITVNQYFDDTGEGMPGTTQCTCNYDELILAVVESLEHLIHEVGLVGYRAMWGGTDFPIGAYLMLKHYTMHKMVFPAVTETIEDNVKTKLDYEIYLITKNLNS